MPQVIVDNRELHYTDSGSAGKPVLLMVHGSGGSHRHWPQRLRESADMRALAVDLPGHGRSAGSGRREVDAYADIVAAFVERLGVRGVTLAGHSLGGAVTLALALRRPPWMAGMVLVGTGCRLRVLPAILDGLTADPAATLRVMAPMMFGPGAAPELAAEILAALEGTPPEVIHGDLSACDRFDVTARLEEIDCPALVVSASEDRMTPVKYGEFLQRHIRGARLAVIGGAGHMMTLEAPEALARAILDFLKTLPAGG